MPPQEANDIRRAQQSDLPQILALTKAWPTHFSPKAIDFIAWDFANANAVVYEKNNRILGYLIWSENSFERELYWLAVAQASLRQRIGTTLVDYVNSLPGPQEILSAKMTDPDANPYDKRISPSAYKGTLAFYESLGFSIATHIPDYWAKGEHCILLRKKIT